MKLFTHFPVKPTAIHSAQLNICSRNSWLCQTINSTEISINIMPLIHIYIFTAYVLCKDNLAAAGEDGNAWWQIIRRFQLWRRNFCHLPLVCGFAPSSCVPTPPSVCSVGCESKIEGLNVSVIVPPWSRSKLFNLILWHSSRNYPITLVSKRQNFCVFGVQHSSSSSITI